MKHLILIIGLAAITGCTTPNPNWTQPLPGQPNTNTAPQFIPDPKIHSYSNQIILGADVVAPFNPYAGLTRPLLEAGLGLFGLISTYVARKKSGALDAMGAGVVKAGAGQAVIAHASNSGHFVEIANAINSATGVNQDNVGAPKT